MKSDQFLMNDLKDYLLGRIVWLAQQTNKHAYYGDSLKAVEYMTRMQEVTVVLDYMNVELNVKTAVNEYGLKEIEYIEDEDGNAIFPIEEAF